MIQDLEYWKERAVRAEGWASVAEHDAVQAALADAAPDVPHVVIDCRSIVGNTPLFWMPNGNGYGSVITDIGRYPKVATRWRETDFPIPLDLAVRCAKPRIDIQLLNRELEILGKPCPKMGWGGSDYARPQARARRR